MFENVTCADQHFKQYREDLWAIVWSAIVISAIVNEMNASQMCRFVNDRTGSHSHIRIHLTSENHSQCGFAQSRLSTAQNVVECPYALNYGTGDKVYTFNGLVFPKIIQKNVGTERLLAPVFRGLV